MAFDKKAPDWKAEGIEPPLSKREIGWEVEDKPPAAWLNWYMNSTSESIQELQTKAVEKIYVDQEIIDAFGGLKDASITEKGLVKLSNSLVSESETEAPTLKAIKKVNDNANLIGDAIEAVNERLDSEKYSSATINAGTQVIQGGATPSIAFPKMGGRTLINLLGDAGNCETLTGWMVETNVTLALATDVKDSGTYSIKATRTTSAGNMYVRSKLSRIDPTKHLLILAWVKNSGVASMGVRLVSSGGAGITGGKSNVVLTGESKTAYQALTPTALGANTNVYIDIYAGINFSIGEYVNMDSVRVLQITAAEYAAIDSMTSDQIAAKYPYVGTGIHGIKDTTITSVQDNLLPPFSEWARLHTNALLISDYKLSHTRTGALIESSSAPNILALPNTDYYLNSGGSLIKVYSSYDGFTYTPLIEISTEGSFKTLPETKYLLIEAYVYTVGTFTWENPILVKGTVAQPFKPQSKTALIAYTELHSNTDGTVKDTLKYVSGKPQKLKRFGKIVLDGALAWVNGGGLSGYRMIALLGLPAGIGYLDLSVTKYDGRPLLPVGNATAADQTYLSIASSYKDLVLTISNADSGWGDAYTPTVNEVKAYFNGWKMADTAGGLWTGSADSIFKRWYAAWSTNAVWSPTALNDFTKAVCPTTQAPAGYTSYNLLYQLATPITEDIQTSGAVVLESGDNYVTATSINVTILPSTLTYANSFYSALNDTEKEIARVDSAWRLNSKAQTLAVRGVSVNTLRENRDYVVFYQVDGPAGLIHLYLSVIRNAESHITQTAKDMLSDRVWTRTCDNNVFTPWAELYTTESSPMLKSYVLAIPAADQAISANTSTKISLPSVAQDFLSEYNGTMSRFTAKKTGVYSIDVALYIVSLPMGNALSIMVYINGIFGYTIERTVSGVTALYLPTGNIEMFLQSGDYVELYISSTSNITIAAGADSRRLSITRLS